MERVEGSRRCLRTNRSWVANSPPLAHAKGQVKCGERGQQWYARPAALFFRDKPCSFNTIAGVTGTRRTLESRTKEQGEWEAAEPARDAGSRRTAPDEPDARGASRRSLQDTKGVPRKTIRGANTALCPEAEALLE